jgi:hypothetical protein
LLLEHGEVMTYIFRHSTLSIEQANATLLNMSLNMVQKWHHIFLFVIRCNLLLFYIHRDNNSLAFENCKGKTREAGIVFINRD